MHLVLTKSTDKKAEWSDLTNEVVMVNKAELQEFLAKVDLVTSAFMPHLKRIAYTPIRELNEMLVELGQARRTLG
jgi:hypothetical protein